MPSVFIRQGTNRSGRMMALMWRPKASDLIFLHRDVVQVILIRSWQLIFHKARDHCAQLKKQIKKNVNVTERLYFWRQLLTFSCLINESWHEFGDWSGMFWYEAYSSQTCPHMGLQAIGYRDRNSAHTVCVCEWDSLKEKEQEEKEKRQ